MKLIKNLTQIYQKEKRDKIDVILINRDASNGFFYNSETLLSKCYVLTVLIQI